MVDVMHAARAMADKPGITQKDRLLRAAHGCIHVHVLVKTSGGECVFAAQRSGHESMRGLFTPVADIFLFPSNKT